LNENRLPTRAVSRGRHKFIGEFKIAAGDLISNRKWVMEYSSIPTGIEKELVRFDMDCERKG